MSQEQFVKDLQQALGAEVVLVGDAAEARYHTDWSGTPPVAPWALVRPRSTEDVSAALRLCHAHRVPVVPQGGLTGLAGGAVPGGRRRGHFAGAHAARSKTSTPAPP